MLVVGLATQSLGQPTNQPTNQPTALLHPFVPTTSIRAHKQNAFAWHRPAAKDEDPAYSQETRYDHWLAVAEEETSPPPMPTNWAPLIVIVVMVGFVVTMAFVLACFAEEHGGDD